jgi:uncharacterized protein (DUF1501 family)
MTPHAASCVKIRQEELVADGKIGMVRVSRRRLLIGAGATAAVLTAGGATAVANHTPVVAYPATSIASGLQLVSQVIASGARLRVAHVTLGGFDTHATQLNEHEKLLGELGDALSAFYADLASCGKDGDVLTLTWSEFGRRGAENASEGTDHGTAAPMFCSVAASTAASTASPPR